jgi:hypothetical protein
MVPVAFAVHPVLVVLFWLTFGAWVALWLGIVRRDRGTDVRTPSDQGSRALIGITLWSGVLVAFLTAWTVPATQIPGRGWAVVLVVWRSCGAAWSYAFGRCEPWDTFPDCRPSARPPSNHRRRTLSPPPPPVLCRFAAHARWPGPGLGNWLSLLAAVLGALVGFTRRIRIEEATMRARFGDAYTTYARCTWRLVPFIW